MLLMSVRRALGPWVASSSPVSLLADVAPYVMEYQECDRLGSGMAHIQGEAVLLLFTRFTAGRC